MKKQYLKLKIRLTVLLVLILLVGCAVLTYQRADNIRSEYWRQISEQEDLGRIMRYNTISGIKDDFLIKTYEAYSKIILQDPDIGFYSMVKDVNRNTIAESQNFMIVKKVDENGEWIDTRILLLGHDYIYEDESSYVSFTINAFSKLEIIGTCDDVFIYPEKIYWTNLSETDDHILIPTENNTSKGTMSFEEWAGETVFYDQRTDNSYYAFVYIEPVHSPYGDFYKSTKLNAEAKEICEQVYEDYANKVRTQDNWIEDNIFTTYIVNTGYINKEYAIPNVYVFHPFNIALNELIGVFILVAIFGVFSIIFIHVTIDKVYLQQCAYEANRRRLTSGIAHELKTPVAIIRGYVENWEQYDENERNEYSKTLIKETDHMSKLVGDFLELSRLEAKAKKLNLESVDLYSLTNSVLNRMQANVRVETDGLEEYLVQADLEMMRTAISNLVSNSIKYSDKMIELKLSENNGKIKFLIANDGAIIDGENMGNVWDEFYKGNKNDYNRFGSDGLGLAITKNIFILHKAQYGCTSKNGRTEFWFELKKDKEE